MKGKYSSFNWKDDWFQYWLWGPVAAYYISWVTDLFGLLLFPVLLTIAQYLSFRKNPFVSKPQLWFYWIIPATYIWLKFGPTTSYSGPFGVGQGILNYYAGQSVATALLMFMTKIKLTYHWIVGNILAALLWFGCYYIPFMLDAPRWLSANYNFALYLFFPTISLLSNAVTGYFLYLSTRVNQGETV